MPVVALMPAKLDFPDSEPGIGFQSACRTGFLSSNPGNLKNGIRQNPAEVPSGIWSSNAALKTIEHGRPKKKQKQILLVLYRCPIFVL